jgi:hypothetical protein
VLGLMASVSVKCPGPSVNCELLDSQRILSKVQVGAIDMDDASRYSSLPLEEVLRKAEGVLAGECFVAFLAAAACMRPAGVAACMSAAYLSLALAFLAAAASLPAGVVSFSLRLAFLSAAACTPAGLSLSTLRSAALTTAACTPSEVALFALSSAALTFFLSAFFSSLSSSSSSCRRCRDYIAECLNYARERQREDTVGKNLSTSRLLKDNVIPRRSQKEYVQPPLKSIRLRGLDPT